jgi:hypothetical protein
MAKLKVIKEVKTPDKWNDVVLSLATAGGFIISDGKMSEVRICAPVFNKDTLILESKFLSYWVEKKLLHQLFDDVVIQQDELQLHFDDIEEQEKIAKERDDALLLLKRKKNKKKKVIIDNIDKITNID